MRILRNCLLLVLLTLLILPQTALAHVSADMHHLLLRLNEDGSLQVREQMVLNQDADTEDQFGIALPEGYEGLELLEGINEADTTTAEGMLLLNSLPQGQSTLKLQYRLPKHEAPHFIINKRLTVPTTAFFVMAERGTLQVNSERLMDAGPMNMAGTDLQLYQAAELQANDTIELFVQLGSSPTEPGAEAPSNNSDSTNHAWERFMSQLPFKGVTALLFLVLAVVLPILALVHFLGQKGKRPTASTKAMAVEAEEESFKRLMLRQKSLKAKLVELEEKYAEETLPENEYNAQREVLKKKLIEVRKELKSYTD